MTWVWGTKTDEYWQLFLRLDGDGQVAGWKVADITLGWKGPLDAWTWFNLGCHCVLASTMRRYACGEKSGEKRQQAVLTFRHLEDLSPSLATVIMTNVIMATALGKSPVTVLISSMTFRNVLSFISCNVQWHSWCLWAGLSKMAMENHHF